MAVSAAYWESCLEGRSLLTRLHLGWRKEGMRHEGLVPMLASDIQHGAVFSDGKHGKFMG